MKNGSKTILIGLLIFLTCLPGLFAQNTFSCENKSEISPRFVVPGGKGVRQVTLSFTVSAGTPVFTITADANPETALPVGMPTTYNGKTVSLNGGPTSFTLTIQPTTSGAVFTSNETWTLKITGLSTSGATNTFTLSSSDLSGLPFTLDPVCFLYAWSWTNATSGSAAIKIPGGQNIDEVVVYLKIESAGTPSPAFRLLPDLGTSTTTYNIVPITDGGSPLSSYGGVNDYSSSHPRDYAYLLDRVSGSTNTWMLEVRKDKSGPFSTPDPFGAGDNLTCILLVQNLSLTDTVYIFCGSRDNASAGYDGTEALDLGLAKLIQPPRPVITNPGVNPCAVIKDRNYIFTSEHNSPDAVSLAYSWTINNGTTTESFSTSQNPVHPFKTINSTDYSLYGDYTITLTMTDTLASGLLGSVSTIQQSAATTLSVSLIAEEKIGFPKYLALPYYPNPPTIDGFISEDLQSHDVDAGWRAASRYAMGSGTTTSPVSFQGMKSASGDALYMSFEVRNDETIDLEDAIVLAFRPDYSTTDNAIKTTAFRTNDVVMIVYPFTSTGGAPGGASITNYQVWKYNGTTWDDVTSTYTPTMAVHSFGVPTDYSWDVEMRLPIGAAPMAINDQFYFYYNVLRVSSGATPDVAEYFWPRLSQNIGTVLRPSALYAGCWSKADKTTGVALDGVWCDWNATSVTPPNPSYPTDDFYITYNNTGAAVANTFTTTVKNDRQKTDNTGTNYVDSPGVKVLLRMANWGIAGANPGPDWSELDDLFPTSSGSDTNPSTAQTVLAATSPSNPGTATYTYTCDVGPASALPANIAAYHHQCLYTELTANDEVYIKTKGVYRNMNFEHASEVRREAIISVRGYGQAPKGRTTHRYLLRTSRKERVFRSGERTTFGKGPVPPGAGANGSDATSYLTWEINGYLCTGKYLVIRGKPFEILNATGSFGYIVEHDGEVAAWDPRIEGARLTGDGSYELEIPAESAVKIVTDIKPVDYTPFSLSLHGGLAFPLANFSATYAMGFCAILDAEYSFTPNLALVLMGGFNYLPGSTSLILPTTIINVALNFRFTLPIGQTFYAYAQAGPDMYIQDFSIFDAGYNGGLGAGLVLSPRFRLELGADYHSTWSQHNWLLQTHLGIVLRL
jgi:hypothetical protein